MTNNDRQYFATIVPDQPGDQDTTWHVVVIESHEVIREPIKARHANDMDALDQAIPQIAHRLGVDIENVEY